LQHFLHPSREPQSGLRRGAIDLRNVKYPSSSKFPVQSSFALLSISASVPGRNCKNVDGRREPAKLRDAKGTSVSTA